MPSINSVRRFAQIIEKQKNKKDNENNWKWIIQIFFITFILSLCFSYISTNGVSKLGIIPAIIIQIIVILIGIVFDLIGVAVTVAKEEELHAKATKKVKGAKTSLKLVKNATKVANICADVVGDMCGVISGAISTMISLKLTEKLGMPESIQFIISAAVAAVTVGGKAIGKEIAKRNSTEIVHTVGKIIGKD